MATTTLTPKQQQVKKLLDEGKTPAEVAKKLKVNVNSVYQHIRRMKPDNGAAPAKPKRSAKRTSARKSTARKSGSRRSTTRRSTTRRPARPRTAPPAPAPVAEVRQMTPLQAIRSRREQIEGEIRESAKRLDAATKAFEHEADAHGKLEASRAAELKQLAAAEAALSNAKPKRSRSGAKSNGSGSKAAARTAAAQTAPAATPEPQSAATPEPDPTPAEAAGTTGSTTEEPQSVGATPEPVEPPTGDAALAAVGAEQERPGVETLPEFSQEGEDAFAGE